MKKLSLFSLFGLAGLLAFLATPIYAQEDEVVLGDEDIVADVENVYNYLDDYDWGSYDYDLSYPNNWIAMSAWTMALLWGLWLGMIIFSCLAFIYGVLVILAQWEVYRKAGKKLWAFLIPFYWTMKYSEIWWMNKWWWILPWLLAIIPLFVTSALLWWSGNEIKWVLWIVILVLSIATLIWWIVVNYRVARRYGWGKFASVLHVLFFPITVLVLWLWNYKYQWQVKKESETIVEA